MKFRGYPELIEACATVQRFLEPDLLEYHVLTPEQELPVRNALIDLRDWLGTSEGRPLHQNYSQYGRRMTKHMLDLYRRGSYWYLI